MCSIELVFFRASLRWQQNSRTQGHEAVLGQVGRVQDRERYGVRDDASRNERIRLHQETERPRREGNDILTPRPPGSRLA